MEIGPQKRTYELASRLVLTIRPTQAHRAWTRRSVILAHHAMTKYMPIADDEIHNALLEENRKKRRVQTRKIDGVTYLRAQPRLTDPQSKPKHRRQNVAIALG